MNALIAAAALLAASTTFAAQRVTVPVDLGIGPAAYFISGPVFADQPVHFGLKFNLAAVIDQEWIQKNPRAVPRRYRGMAKNVEEVRISPSLLIPDALFISPKIKDTGIFGVTWRPLALRVPLISGPLRLRVGAGVLATYFFLFSDTLPNTHFLRPGVDLMAEMEIAFSKSFLISLGWASGFYVPQELGSFGIGPIDNSVWHVGQAFLQLHFRFPVTRTL